MMCYDVRRYEFADGCALAEADNSTIGICYRECEFYKNTDAICDPQANGRSRQPWPHSGPRFPEFICENHDRLIREGKKVTPRVYPGITSWIFNGNNADYIKDAHLRRTLQEEILAKRMLDLAANSLALVNKPAENTFVNKPVERILTPAVERRAVGPQRAIFGPRPGRMFGLRVNRS